ncbi:FecR family protein [Pseudoflavitalea sp. X16]|uniref:FecR family protein n=1 Tax=Paraflavitalea devenefica TaxID=2716334 RepID=UPI00141DB823|nr:FecR family protein [Paraflavitalea devenefica]NII29680.1 FecR family protein [Paraflavitalea devenefica]
MTSERLATLIDKYLSNTASPEEEQELTAWYQAANEQEVQWPVADEQEATALKAKLLNRLQQAMHPAQATIPSIPFYRKMKWQAAAAIGLLISAGAWLWFSRSPQTGPVAINKTNTTVPIVPGGNKAILTLADGSTIILDSAANGMLSQQGSTKILKTNSGRLAYSPSTGESQGEIAYNTVSTPRGGQYEIILPDGSHVWLNAASSLRFPAAFSGKERTVELTGEAYFEVAKNPSQPFKVFLPPLQGPPGGAVEVLGTHFNINAYHDEANIKTTLLEGSVKIEAGGQTSDFRPQTSTILKPGQQAQISDNSSSIRVIPDIDTEEAIAWKNGKFQFNQADIRTVMRQIARWYDVEVVYEGTVSAEKFEGEIPRNSTLAEVFKILEISAVHFKTEGRKIIVMP